MENIYSTELMDAIRDFRKARQKAAMQDILFRLTGQQPDLLSFDEIRQKFRPESSAMLGLQDVPLDAIVGSVDRYHDFNRNYLPRLDSDQSRWAGIMAAQMGPTGLPPIDLYKLGDVYFVVDGNHRVSVARQVEMKTIQAYVTEFRPKVPLQPGDRPDDIIIKAEYADFLEKTALDHLRPGANFMVTTPGRYWVLETQIEAHRYWMENTGGQPVPFQAAVTDWYDNNYKPTIDLIREKGILRDFPGRTETDMYLWIFKHQNELKHRLGWVVDAESAASDLLSEQSPATEKKLARLGDRLRNSLIPDSLETGPAPGQWRREWLEVRPRDRLFANILLLVNDQAASQVAMTQALAIASWEQSQIYGIHITANSGEGDNSAAAETLFNRSCREAQVAGQLAVTHGDPVDEFIDRGRWVDLIVIHPGQLSGPEGPDMVSYPLRSLIQRSPRPVLVIRQAQEKFRKVLVGFDGSPKSKEGLYVAVYLAQRHQTELVVLTVTQEDSSPSRLDAICDYLATQPVEATHLVRQGSVADIMLATAAEQQCDLIIMGGFGHRSLLSTVLGSTVDGVLARSPGPVLICR
jgi:nucleotide-binding universal stress UspA family protein